MTAPQAAAAGIQAAAASAVAFAAAAKAGQFAVNESGGGALVKALRAMQDWIVKQELDLYQLEQQPRLGSSNAAEAMKPFMLEVATDANGFITQLRALKDTLRNAEEAILLAMSNYRAVDQENADTLTRGE